MAVRYFSPLDKVQQKQWEQSLLREYEDKDNLLALKILLEKEMTPELRNSLKTNKPVLLNEELPKDKDGPYIPKGRTAILQVLARDPNLGTTDGTKSNAGIYVTLKGYKTSKQIYANTNRGAGSTQLFADGVRIKIDSPGNYTLNGEITNGDGTNDNTSLEIRVK